MRGMILQRYAVTSTAIPLERIREGGVLAASVSINSSAAALLLGSLVHGPLSGLDLSTIGPAGVMFPARELGHLNAMLTSSGADQDIANAMSDAIDGTIAQRASS